MPTRFWVRFTGIAGLGVLAAVVAACDVSIGAAEYSVREEKKFTVTGAPEVVLTTFDGSIEVRGWDRQEVLVEVEKRGADRAAVDTIQVKATQVGQTITIDVPKPARIEIGSWRRSPSARLVVSVPVQSNVVAKSGDGSIKLRHLAGRIDLHTGDGSVTAEDVKGELVVHTGDGSIRARRIDGRADIETGDGSVGLEGVLRTVRVDTSDGSVEVSAGRGSAMDADWSVTTGDGSIRMELPDGFNAELEASSGDGRVHVEQMTGSQDRERRERGRDAFKGTLGAGGKLVKLRSGSGSVTVKRW